MYLRIRHATTYRYAVPVSFGPHRLMLRPRDSFDLRLVDTALTVSPDANLRWMHDAYGNPVALADFAQPAETLEIVSELVIERFGSALPRSRLEPRTALTGVVYSDGERTVLQPYLARAAADPDGILERWLADFRARLGQGSEFVFEIPAVAATEPPQGRLDILSGRRAVIVSKNAVEADAIARTIRAHGGVAELAATAAQAIPLAARCDVLLVDAAMEESDGRLLKRLRHNGFADCEAITLIAPTDRGMLGEFRANGYATFLARPVRGATLLRVLLSQATTLAQPHVEKRGTPSPRASNGRRQGLSVLIAEDNDINAMLARATLLKAGHRVKIVGNGKAAVDAVTDAGLKFRFDVVLMDLHMPVMDGLDAIAAIRRHEESLAMPPIPIMVLSADSQEKTRHAVLAHGASGFVTKPLDPDALVQAVEGQVAA